jgi:hypothetical protein
VGIFYAAIAVLGAAYALFEQHQASLIVFCLEEMMPAFLILVLVVVVYGLLRTTGAVLKQLNGASRAAHVTLHVDYGKK